jgi:hypothetical protein
VKWIETLEFTQDSFCNLSWKNNIIISLLHGQYLLS